MPRTLDPALLRTFVAVADRASMTAAANALHLTQGAVSQQIKRLEDLLGCALLTRARHGPRLTPPGDRLIGKARRLLALNDEICADMTGMQAGGSVRLGVPYDLVGTGLATVLKAFADACPNVALSLRCASSPELTDALANGVVDLAVVEEALESSTGERLSVEPLVWVGARGGGAHRKQPLPVSIVADTCAFRPAVLAALRGQGREWRMVFENGGFEATTATVRADLAVSAWLAFAVPPGLAVLPREVGLPELPPFAVTLHRGASHADPVVAELARHIRHAFIKVPEAA